MAMSDKTKDQVVWIITDDRGNVIHPPYDKDGNMVLGKGTYTMTSGFVKLPSRHTLVNLGPVVFIGVEDE